MHGKFRTNWESVVWTGLVALMLVSIRPAMAKSEVKLDVSLGTPKVLAGAKQTAILKVGVKGHSDALKAHRAPVNVALVLDRSGSMNGDKLEQAKQAAAEFVNRLRADDIVSVVIYDHVVEVLVPSTKAADREAILEKIRQIRAGGNTALFGGVSKGAAETRKFLEPGRVNRVILLSDGLANVGPATPEEMGSLGASLIREGISVSTIGLGLDWNEELMYSLAAKSDGNPVFVESERDLPRIFAKEFESVSAVIASNVKLEIKMSEGVRPVRVLGGRADIEGNMIHLKFNQLYHDWENYILVEVELPEGTTGQSSDVASVRCEYTDVETKGHFSISGKTSAQFVSSEKEVADATNAYIMASSVNFIAHETNLRAQQLRDLGRFDEARSLNLSNEDYLFSNIRRYGQVGEQVLRGNSILQQQQIVVDPKDAPANNRLKKSVNTRKQSDTYRVYE